MIYLFINFHIKQDILRFHFYFNSNQCAQADGIVKKLSKLFLSRTEVGILHFSPNMTDYGGHQFLLIFVS